MLAAIVDGRSGAKGRFVMQGVSRGRQLRFIAALAKGGDVTGAAINAHLDRARLDEARRIDRTFAREWEAAEKAATQKLEQEAWRRAVQGVPEPLVNEGKLVRDDDGRPVSIQRYSDSVLIELLRMSRTRKSSERAFLKAVVRLRLIRPIVLIVITAIFVSAIGGAAVWWAQNHMIVWTYH
jgi:hypothetical protein